MKQAQQEAIDLFHEELYAIRLMFSVEFKQLFQNIENIEAAYKKLCEALNTKPSEMAEWRTTPPSLRRRKSRKLISSRTDG